MQRENLIKLNNSALWLEDLIKELPPCPAFIPEGLRKISRSLRDISDDETRNLSGCELNERRMREIAHEEILKLVCGEDEEPPEVAAVRRFCEQFPGGDVRAVAEVGQMRVSINEGMEDGQEI